jgi:hypothetical protein
LRLYARLAGLAPERSRVLHPSVRREALPCHLATRRRGEGIGGRSLPPALREATKESASLISFGLGWDKLRLGPTRSTLPRSDLLSDRQSDVTGHHPKPTGDRIGARPSSPKLVQTYEPPPIAFVPRTHRWVLTPDHGRAAYAFADPIPAGTLLQA